MRVPWRPQGQIKSLVAWIFAVWYSYKICWMGAFFYGHQDSGLLHRGDRTRPSWYKVRKERDNCCDPSKEMLPAGFEPARSKTPMELKSIALDQLGHSSGFDLRCCWVVLRCSTYWANETIVSYRTRTCDPRLKRQTIIAVTTPWVVCPEGQLLSYDKICFNFLTRVLLSEPCQGV